VPLNVFRRVEARRLLSDGSRARRSDASISVGGRAWSVPVLTKEDVVRMRAAHHLKASRGAGRKVRSVSALGAVFLALAAFTACARPPGGGPQARQPNPWFCQKLKNGTIFASQGAQMYCFGPQPNQVSARPNTARPAAPVTPGNLAASNLSEDVAPNGTRGYGQSETSVAANGPYVVEAWNDATAFFSPCGSPQNKEEAIGLAFSADRGKTFTDLGGLPNNSCASYLYVSDPSVETVTIGGVDYFYITGMFDSVSGQGPSKVAMSVCTATGTGAGANLACGQPQIVAQSSECATFSGGQFCSVLDKDFATVDPVRQRLYVSFTEFGATSPMNSIELAACDISNPTVPSCSNGGNGPGPQAPYLVVAPTPANGCENEGAYPAVDYATGDVYVAYEHNIGTNTFSFSPCGSDPVRNVVNRIPFAHLTLPMASGGPTATTAINVTSMDNALVPGYNRFLANDFPRIAVSGPFHTVSIVWNDSRYHPLGDILMQSYSLGSLSPASALVRLNQNVGGLQFLPALRNADDRGLLNVSWYERATGNTTITNVEEAPGVPPNASATPTGNVLITDVPTDWNAVSSDIVPNFGDYTDNYVLATPSGPHVDGTLNIAWSDGRAGVPQAFYAGR
jgi:hypothetical protein